MTKKYQQIKELMALTTELVLAEKQAELADLSRIQTIMGDSVAALRESFGQFNQLLEQRTAEGHAQCPPQGARTRPEQAEEVYRRSITALQFEDIVQQIIAFARFRGQEIERILHKVESGVDALGAGDFDRDELARLVASVTQDIQQFHSVLGSASPVRQHSMRIGEAELF